MTRYARETTVAPEQTRAEIERLVARYGATGFYFATDPDRAIIGFRMRDRVVKFSLPIAPVADFDVTPTGRYRSPAQARNAAAQDARSRWRALKLIILAKLEAIDAGIVTFEDEFLGNTVMPNGETVAEWVGPQLVEAYSRGLMPGTLPMLAAPK